MRLTLASVQWFFFILANSIIAPIAIGFAFGMSSIEISEFIQRTLFLVGLGALIQIFWGHKLPIFEGPAGMWWAVFFSLASLAPTLDHGAHGALQSIVMGFILSGVITVILSVFKLIHLLKRLFTPLFTGTFLILLVLQLSGNFVKGMLGIREDQPFIDWQIAAPSFLVLAISVFFAYSRFQLLKNYSVLIGILFGWLLFTMLGLTQKGTPDVPWFSLPEILPWGSPKFDLGILITAMVMGLIMLTNLMTSIEVIGNLVGASKPTEQVANRSSFWLGVNQILSGLFGTAGFVPVTFTAGFIITTGVKQKLPYIIGCILILGVSFFPKLIAVLSLIPVPVAFAVSLLSFSRLLILGIKEYSNVPGNEMHSMIVCITMVIGVGSMFIPREAVLQLPTFLASIINNGLIMGVLTCILLESIIRLKNRTKSS